MATSEKLMDFVGLKDQPILAGTGGSQELQTPASARSSKLLQLSAIQFIQFSQT